MLNMICNFSLLKSISYSYPWPNYCLHYKMCFFLWKSYVQQNWLNKQLLSDFHFHFDISFDYLFITERKSFRIIFILFHMSAVSNPIKKMHFHNMNFSFYIMTFQKIGAFFDLYQQIAKFTSNKLNYLKVIFIYALKKLSYWKY